MGSHHQDPFDTLDELAAVLAKLPGSGPKMYTARKLVERLGPEIEAQLLLAERRGFAPRKKPKLAKAVTGYAIEDSRQGPALSEHRSTGAAPFRCPKFAYDAVAKAIQDGPEIQKFEEIRDRVTKILGEEPPVFWVRVAMRFFVNEGALTHSRARYLKSTEQRITRLGTMLWDRLKNV